MNSSQLTRRGVALAALTTLVAGPAIVGPASPASAAACTGVVTHSSSSRFNSIVGYFYSSGGNGVLKPGQGRTGTSSKIITRFSTPADKAFKVVYRDLRYNDYRIIATHNLEHGGYFDINPCHWATVTVF